MKKPRSLVDVTALELQGTPLGVLVNRLVREAIDMDSRTAHQSPTHRLALSIWYRSEGNTDFDGESAVEFATAYLQRRAASAFEVKRPEKKPWEKTEAEYRLDADAQAALGKHARQDQLDALRELGAWLRAHPDLAEGLFVDRIEDGSNRPHAHKAEVIRALYVGYPVPAHVLAGYPDVTARRPKTVAPPLQLPPNLPAEFERVCARLLQGMSGPHPLEIPEIEELEGVLRAVQGALRGLGPQWWLAETQIADLLDDTLQGLRTNRAFES